MDEKIPVRNAATVILLRDGPDGTPEIFLIRRHPKQSFMGDAFVFPGGTIDASDADAGLAPYITGPDPSTAAARLQEQALPASLPQAIYLGAIRETFEEAGILLAYDANGQPLRIDSPDLSARYAAARIDIYRKKRTMKDLALGEKIRYGFDLLIPYARWITPVVEKKRFDTRFFLARIPRGQEASHDNIEAMESCWLSPSSALTRHRQARILLMPPTLKTVEELSRFRSTEALFQNALSRRIYPILPHPCRAADSYTLLLPHDRDYPIEAYRQTGQSDDPSRIVLRQGGVWETASAP